MQDLIVITMVIGLLVVVIVAPLTTYPLGRRRLRRLVLAGGATYLATMTASLIAFGIGTLIASASAALIAAAAAMLAGGYTLGVIFGLAAITLLRSSRPNQPSPTSNTDSASSLT